MSRNRGNNMGILSLIHGGRYGTRTTSAERAMEQKIRERTARRIAADARKQDKALYNVAEDVTHPARHFTRLFQKAKSAKWTKAEVRDVFILPQVEYLDAVFGNDTGEFRPAA